MKHKQLGRWQVWSGVGVALCLDRFDRERGHSWRVLVANHPMWLPFSERQGWRPKPRIWQVGRYDVAFYPRKPAGVA